MDYNTLVAAKSTAGSICSWIANDTIPATVILGEAQAYIYRRLRVREMIATQTGTITQSATSLALPSNYLATVRLKATSPSTFEITHRLLEDIDGARTYDSTGVLSTGQPQDFSAAGTSAEFAVQSDRAYTYQWRFYQQPDDLSTATTTNFLTNKGSRLIRATCMAFASEFMKDAAQMSYWLKIATNEIEQLMIESDSELRNAYIPRGGL